jgi:Fe-S-cluster containining protein
MAVFALAAHAGYRCRQTGRCCRAGWDVPVEPRPLRMIRQAAAAGDLVLPPGALLEAGLLPEGAAAVLGRSATGACLLQDPASGLCTVHAAAGEAALPTACRRFPRVALRDGRGTFVTLSHYCPTASRLLFADVPIAIVRGPDAFPEDDYDGLDARGELPPLLRPSMLMDSDGYAAWEAHMIATLDAASTPPAALAMLRADAVALARWRPGDGALAGAVSALDGSGHVDAPPPATLYEEVYAAIPIDLRADVPKVVVDLAMFDAPALAAPVRRFLAAHAFASWCAYQGRGVRTIIRSLDAVLAVLAIEAARLSRETGRALDPDLLAGAFGEADLRLRHQADRQALADAWSAAEHPPVSRQA